MTFYDIGCQMTSIAPASSVFLAKPKTVARGELFLWVVVAIFANYFLDALQNVSSTSIAGAINDLLAVGLFQYLGWYAVVRLLLSSADKQAATRLDFAIAIALIVTCLAPGAKIVWIAATAAAAYLFVTSAGGTRLKAAATVLGALAVQGLWGHVVFSLFAFELLRLDTAIAGMLLSATQPGIIWHDNLIINMSSNHSTIIMSACSSFHNVSVALLGWVTLTKLERPGWVRSDFLFGAIVALTIILLNVVRLYLTSLDYDSYLYWHFGFGASIFAFTASLATLVIGLYGASRGSERA